MSTSIKRIIHFGLAGHPTDSSISEEKIQATVTAGADKAREAGYEVQLTFFDIENFEQALNGVKQELETGKWDALIVGGGIRLTTAFTPQLERTINVAKKAAPATMILFQMAPGDIYETIQRGFE